MEKEIYNLTFSQNNIWLMDRMYHHDDATTITGVVQLRKNFNVYFCEACINQIVKSNDAMRIQIKMKDSQVYQTIRNYTYEKVEIVDMTLWDSEKKEQYIKEITATKIDTFADRLYEFKILKDSEDTGRVFLKVHHMIADAWSLTQMIEQFKKYFNDLKEKGKIEEIEVPSYIDFIKSQKEYILSDKYKKDESYFKEYLKNLGDVVSLKEKSKTISPYSKRYHVKLDKEINEQLDQFCKENRISPYVLFLTILSIYLYRTQEKEDIVIGTPVLNRANFKEKQMLGLFMTTIPMRIKIQENRTVLELLKEVVRNTMTAFRHQRFPYDSVLEEIRKENGQKNKLYHILFSYQNARLNTNLEEKYTTKWYESHTQNEELQIHIFDMDNTGILEISYDYLSDLFSEEEIIYLHDRLMFMMKYIIKNQDANVETIPIFSYHEKEKLLSEFNATRHLYPKNKSVIDLFEEQVKKTPNKVATIFDQQKLTYQELNEYANKIANYLLKQGIKPKDIVAVLMKRSHSLIASILAILKCRAGYLPIDSTYPIGRIEYILENSNACAVIKEKESKSTLKNIKEIYIDEEELNNQDFKKENLGIPFSSNSINYLIYTSGSTGNPKGVAVSCENLVNFVLGMKEVIHITEEDRVVSITTISFDIFGFELWVTLLSGATMVLANESECIDGDKLNKLCLKHHVTVIQTTPTKLKMLLKVSEYIFYMKKILLGGEKVPKDFVDRLKGLTKSSIYDVYGPTETTIWSTVQDITNIPRISVGKPIANTRIYILDKKNRVLPIGVNGQVGIAGDSVSLGYYHNQELTDQCYINHKELGERIYLTGDLGRFNFDSTISILDRIDLQIKLNGQRIELEEIERNILMDKNIKEAAVVLKQGRVLVCYYIRKDSSKKIEEDEIAKFLYERLPVYMVPTVYKELESFPLTLNGKTDRKALANLEFDLTSDILYEKPKTKLQEMIYSIWVKVLGKESFGIHDKFFEIGADSLTAIKTQIELLSHGIHLEYKDLLKYQSIEELEKYIIKNKKEKKEKSVEKYQDFSDILGSNRFDMKSDAIKKSGVKNILLTGATGFLGIHILDEFMKKELGKIYCIIRGKNRVSAKDRLLDRLHYYFGNRYDLELDKRIIVVDGNFIDDEFLGMKEEDYRKVVNDIDLVIHSAACVKHYGDANYFKKINMDGTQKIAKFCYENHKKLMHVSTISVSGNSFEMMKSNLENVQTKVFDETCFYQEQDLNNIYVYTKFKAEEIVLEYMKKGLNANILRVGNLTGRYEDLKFQYNIDENAFSKKVKTFIDIGFFPKSNRNVYLEFTPVDSCARAIIKIMQYFNQTKNLFHLYDHEHVYIQEFIAILKELNIQVDIVEDEQFRENIERIARSENNQILNGIINDLNEKNLLDYQTDVKVQSDYTRNYLKKIGFEWEKIDRNYIIRYINYLRKISFLDK